MTISRKDAKKFYNSKSNHRRVAYACAMLR